MKTSMIFRFGLSGCLARLGGSMACSLLLALALSGCGGGGGTTTASLTSAVPPGVPTSFTVARTQSQTLSATLNWEPPADGSAPVSYEIYRSTTAGTAYSADNHVISIPAVAGQASYSFIDDAGLSAVDTYWVVSARNVAGEAPTAEVSYKPVGPASGGESSFGNNLSSPLVFADGIGLAGAAISGSWTDVLASVDYNTGLRPISGILPSSLTTLPYLDSADTYALGGATYYKQGTSSTWQAQWSNGSGTLQHVAATWGDNLTSQSLTSTSTIRVEVALAETVPSPMTAYTMQSLYGTQVNEVQGTDGTTYTTTTAAVFAANAHLTVQKLDASGVPVYTLYDQTLWQGDGPGYFAAEVTVSGAVTYGFVWPMKSVTLPAGISKDGTWRITLSLDSTSPKGTANNTEIDSATNGVLDSASQTHIDVNIVG